MQDADIGVWLKRRRAELSLTQQQLGQRVGASVITIRKLEANARKPSSEMAQALLQALAIPETQRSDFLAAAANATDERDQSAPGHFIPLIGREADLAAVLKLLERDDVRLITLTGPGGVGKTSLAREVAYRIASQKQNAVWVELAALAHANQVLPAIARALGLLDLAANTQVPLLQRLAEYVANAPTVLMLDNAEHVLGATNQIAELLRRCPNLTVLVTSRTPLHLPGERRFAVSPLPPQAAQHLFAERAQEVAPQLTLNPATESAIRQLCAHLDGLPLAIELVAARAALMTPQTMLRHFITNDALALPLVADGVSNLPERQRTLQASIQWSLDLLSSGARRTFRFLSVFGGAFTLDAAVRVACLSNEVADEVNFDPTPDQQVAAWNTLTTLLEANLLVRTDDGDDVRGDDVRGDEPRFNMLETLHAAAHAELVRTGEQAQARERHLHYIASLVETCVNEHDQTYQIKPLQRVLAVMPDVLAATEYAIAQGQAEQACRLCADCVRVWMDFGYFAEGLAITQRALSLPMAESPSAWRARAGAMLVLIRLSAQTSDQTRMVAMCDEVSALCHRIGYAQGIWQVQHQQAWLRRGINPTEGWAMHVALLEEARRKEDVHWIAIKLADLALMSCYDYADHAAVLRYTDEALALFETMNDHWGMCYALITRGAALRASGRLDEALETLNHAQSLGAHMLPAQHAHLEDVLGMVCLEQKNFDAAVMHFAASVQLLRQIGSSFSQHSALANQGVAEVVSGQLNAAAQNLLRAMSFFEGVPEGDPSSAVARCNGARCRIGLAHLAAHAGRSDEAAALLREAQGAVDKYPTAFDKFVRGMLREVETRLAA